MAQFTIYKSSDAGAPFLYGTTGSLIVLLDACLVNGYGTKSAAGWLKPLPNTGSGIFSQSYGCYQQPTGSGMTLFINDNGPSGSGVALYKEAWAVGWENLTSLSSSTNNTCGSGTGQFPTPAQSLTTGHVVIRKSNTNDSSSLRQWAVLADSSSFYLLIATGDVANTYYGFMFGDIYSFKTGSYDQYKCIIMGRNPENTSNANADGFDYISLGWNTAVGGNFMARSFTGLGTSITIAKHGDGVKGNANFYYGVVNMPNGSDNAFYMSPVWIVEAATATIRGQLRGLYQPLHPITNFVDGQTFSGSLDENGKTFQVFKTTPNSGMYIFETSNTLLTN